MNTDKNKQNSTEKALTIPVVSKRKFWKIQYETWGDGEGGLDYTEVRIYWGTWMEAARECVKNDESVCRPKWRRKIEPFELPNTKGKRKGFYVC